jgi:hypothetical protein
MYRQSVLAYAEDRFPKAGWVIVEGHHDEVFVVSSRDRRTEEWDSAEALRVAAEVVREAAVRLSQSTTAAAKLGHSSRAYVGVQSTDGTWAVADAFVRLDDIETLPFDPPASRV